MSISIEWRGNQHTNKSSRRGNTPLIIVNHITTSTKYSADSWFRSPNNNQSSCHYLVNKDGTIYQYVDLKENAWCNGLRSTTMSRATSPFLIDYWKKNGFVNPNWISVSIEHEAFPEDKQLTEPQYQATLRLHIHIKRVMKDRYKYDMPIDRKHIIGHKEIDKINKPFCPMDDFPYERLMNDMRVEFEDENKNLDNWMQEMGITAIESLADLGYLASPEYWLDHDLSQPVPYWLFFAMLNKLAKDIKGEM